MKATRVWFDGSNDERLECAPCHCDAHLAQELACERCQRASSYPSAGESHMYMQRWKVREVSDTWRFGQTQRVHAAGQAMCVVAAIAKPSDCKRPVETMQPIRDEPPKRICPTLCERRLPAGHVTQHMNVEMMPRCSRLPARKPCGSMQLARRASRRAGGARPAQPRSARAQRARTQIGLKRVRGPTRSPLLAPPTLRVPLEATDVPFTPRTL